MSVTLQAKDIKLVKLKDLKPNPGNRNTHSDEQIDRLVKIIKYQGFRNPLIVSNQSGYVVAGHGRMLAAAMLDMKEVPVIYQDFENSEVEYAAMLSDNSIASWAELDLSAINSDIPDLGPDFNIDLLGVKDFLVEPADHGDDLTNLEKYKTSDEKLEAFLGHETRKIIIAYSGQRYIEITQALEQLCKAKDMKDYSEAIGWLLDEYCANN